VLLEAAMIKRFNGYSGGNTRRFRKPIARVRDEQMGVRLRVEPDAETVAMMQAEAPAIARAVFAKTIERMTVPEPKPAEREVQDVRVGDVWRADWNGGDSFEYRIQDVGTTLTGGRELLSGLYTALSLHPSGVANAVGVKWTLVSRAQPEPQGWRDCATAEEALRMAGFVEPRDGYAVWWFGKFGQLPSVWPDPDGERWLYSRDNQEGQWAPGLHAAIAHALGLT
jgi:hypothetical protein